MEQSQRISEKVEKDVDRFISRLLRVISDNDMTLSLDGKELTVDDLHKSKDILISDIKNLFHEFSTNNRLSEDSPLSDGYIPMKSKRSTDDSNKDRSIEDSSEIKLKEIRKLNDREDDEVKGSKRLISTIQEIKPLNPVKKIESLNIQEHSVTDSRGRSAEQNSVPTSSERPLTNHVPLQGSANRDKSVNNSDHFMTTHEDDEHSVNNREDHESLDVLEDKHRKDRIVMVNDYLFNEIRSIIDNLENPQDIKENLYMLYDEGICSESLLKDMIPDSSEIIENNFKYLNDIDIEDKDKIIRKCKEEYDIYQELLR